MHTWFPIATAPEHVLVRTRLRGERGPPREALLIRRGQLWFTPGVRPTFVHRIPTEWRPQHALPAQE
ncbi:hypothetical protein Q5H91_10465 [Sphingomonas sp. KR1UV-12]|uniref:Uncharacterized protein n=1 Tax=Sphingomonas aurea TaxID=3063994 RepID=A0ABT9ELD0_9SPHN|nr:hypothetical protein [Sphingomonas sp. KR1UV-12]MDP1027637.1 hypothetical protein [Sphingomonas sp. KR1UV-12]